MLKKLKFSKIFQAMKVDLKIGRMLVAGTAK
jgi:hypothetical protein